MGQAGEELAGLTEGELQAELAHHHTHRPGQDEVRAEDGGRQEVAPRHQAHSPAQPSSQRLQAAVLEPAGQASDFDLIYCIFISSFFFINPKGQ